VNTSIIPLAITMMAGPQIMTAIIFVTHPTPLRVSLPFLVGVAAAATLGTTIYFLIAGAIDLGDPSDNESTGQVIQYVLAGLLALLAIRTYRNREHVEPPKWMGALLQASPGRALVLGFLLIFLMPTDIATMIAVGVNLQAGSDSLVDALPFLGLTLLIAASPLLAYLLFHKRAVVAMPKVRDWMKTNAWLVNIIVLCIFIYLILA
jgi:Sap, sulfolipid-1-addressing protein